MNPRTEQTAPEREPTDRAPTEREPGEPNLVVSRLNVGRFALVHLICLGAIYTGVEPIDLALAAGLYLARMFGVTAGYHRYFSHRSFKTGRAFQFALAFLAQSSGQKSALWWAAHHRHHHRHSDGPEDVHSPRRGLWWSHVGWILSPDTEATRFENVRDLTRYPELMWLHRFQYTPAVAAGLLCLAIGGWSGWVVGFFWSTIALYHATFTINSLSHVFGAQPFETGDDSRNNLWLALLTLGEGWHNNHHHYQTSARQGFLWWQIDLTWYALLLLEKLGVIWDLRRPPERLVAQARAAA